jgi:caa(3)-type oxidase subunit IV
MSDEHHGTHHGNYVKIWAILVVLLLISVLGPTLEIKIVTLITAFGIAVVKAYLVVKNFMHLNVQPRFILYLMGTCLVFMLLFFAGTAPDVMKDDGDNWIKLPLAQTAEMTHEHAPH